MFGMRSIRVKLVTSYVMLTLLLTLVGGYGYNTMGEIEVDVQRVLEESIASEREIYAFSTGRSKGTRRGYAGSSSTEILRKES